MAEYISKEFMLQNLESDKMNNAEHCEPVTVQIMERFIRYVKEFPAADVQPVDRWISVKDRLPDKDGNYLCYLECGAVCQSTFDSTIASEGEEFPFGEWVGVYNSDTLGFTDSYWEEHDAITHWMTLPEPPKDGDAE
jgi:hypothetical protein